MLILCQASIETNAFGVKIDAVVACFKVILVLLGFQHKRISNIFRKPAFMLKSYLGILSKLEEVTMFKPCVLDLWWCVERLR